MAEAVAAFLVALVSPLLTLWALSPTPGHLRLRVALLKIGLHLYLRPWKWTRGRQACDENGTTCSARSPLAQQFCAEGWMIRAGINPKRGGVGWELFANANGVGPVAFNDAQRHWPAWSVAWAFFRSAFARLSPVRPRHQQPRK